MKEISHLCSQIRGDVENAVSLHVDIPRTNGKCSELPHGAVLQEYVQLPYEYLLLVLPFGGYSCN
jgi:hypothetical protein